MRRAPGHFARGRSGERNGGIAVRHVPDRFCVGRRDSRALDSTGGEILNLGDPALPLVVSDWVKGDKIEKLAPGKTYDEPLAFFRMDAKELSGRPKTVPQQKPPPNAGKQPERVDALGDPLPPGALLRMGSTRLRHPGSATSVVYVGDLLASSGRDGVIRFWDRATGKVTRSSAGPTGQLYALAYSPDRNLLAAVGPSGDVYLWDAATGKEVQRFKGAGSSPIPPAFSPGGNMLAVGDKAGVRIWDVESGKQLRMLDVPG